MDPKRALNTAIVIALLALHFLGRAAPAQAAASAGLPPLAWQIVTVDSTGDVGRFASLALRPTNGVPYVGYYDASNGRVKWAIGEPGQAPCAAAGWQCRFHPTANHVGQHTSLAFQTSGAGYALATHDVTDAAAAYFGASDDSLGSVLHVDEVAGITGWHNSLKFASSGLSRIAYYQALPAPSALRYAAAVGSGNGNCGANGFWGCQTIESGPGVGVFASLDLNGLDVPYIAYGGPNGELKLARSVGSGGNCGPSNSWQCDVIDATVSAKYISLHAPKCLALCDDALQIAYHDTAGQQLKYARAVGAGNGNCGPANGWKCEVIDGTGTAGLGEAMGVSLAVYQGEPLIAYYDDNDQVNGILKIARRHFGGNCGPFVFGSRTWQCEAVDNGVAAGFPVHDVGQYASLALNPSTGRAVIAYYNATSGDLRLALQMFEVFVPVVGR